MAGLTTPPLTPPTTGHTGPGDDGAPHPSTESAKRATIYDDPAFASFFVEHCQGRYELSYRSETGI
jgi:hypothetical protein